MEKNDFNWNTKKRNPVYVSDSLKNERVRVKYWMQQISGSTIEKISTIISLWRAFISIYIFLIHVGLVYFPSAAKKKSQKIYLKLNLNQKKKKEKSKSNS